MYLDGPKAQRSDMLQLGDNAMARAWFETGHWKEARVIRCVAI
jgi:hypothetical protein